MLGRAVRHLLVHPLLEIFNRRQHGINLHVLDRILRYLALQYHTLLLVLFLDRDTFLLKIFYDHSDTVVGVLIHEDVQDPGLAVLYSTPVHRDLIVGGQTMIYFLKRSKASPRL